MAGTSKERVPRPCDLHTDAEQPDGAPKAKVVFIHGYNDHINRYYGFFPALAARGIAVYGFDQRGWGNSVSKRSEKGLTGPTSRVIDDVVAFLTPHLPRELASETGDADPPVFVVGHSMGGGQALTLASDASRRDVVRRVRGWVLESPLVAFAPEQAASPLKALVGRLVSRVLPHRQMFAEVRAESCTRDPKVAADMRTDPLCHQTGTLEGLAGLLDRTAALTRGTARPLARGAVRSLWIGHGTADKITDFPGCKRYFDECTTEVPDRTFKTYEGWYHVLHADGPESETFHRDVGDWILARCGPEEEGATAADVAKL